MHRTSPEAVHFHEVGALDAVADIVGACAGAHWLREHRGVDAFLVGPVEAGSGARVRSAHGLIPVPVPAVLELAARAALALTGRLPYEAATPTGLALLATLAEPVPAAAAGCARWPPATARAGATRRRRPTCSAWSSAHLSPAPGRWTAARTPTRRSRPGSRLCWWSAMWTTWIPRLWPGVLGALLDAGAADAWLTPVVMKKGRPAHTLHVLCAPERLAALRRLVYAQTSTIGLRESPVTKRPLPREQHSVELDGHPVGVKVSRLDGRVAHVSVEYEDVRRIAEATGRPAKQVLGAAQALADEAYRQG